MCYFCIMFEVCVGLPFFAHEYQAFSSPFVEKTILSPLNWFWVFAQKLVDSIYVSLSLSFIFISLVCVFVFLPITDHLCPIGVWSWWLPGLFWVCLMIFVESCSSGQYWGKYALCLEMGTPLLLLGLWCQSLVWPIQELAGYKFCYCYGYTHHTSGFKFC